MRKIFLILIIATASVLAFCTTQFLAVDVGGSGMVPTLKPGATVVVYTAAFRRDLPKRWEIVAFRDKGKGELQILRVVGLPEEIIELNKTGLFIDGKLTAPPASLGALSYYPVVDGKHEPLAPNPSLISVNSFFLLGDNSAVSRDSRFFGEIDSTSLVGKVVMY